MSERSKKLARCIRRARGCSAETKQDNRDEFFDKGFAYLKIDLASEFHNQIIEVNHEPGCVGTLGSTFTDKELSAFKIGEEYKGLSIHFDPNERTAEIKGREPVAFYYLIQVRLFSRMKRRGATRVRDAMESLCQSEANSITLLKKRCSRCSELMLDATTQFQLSHRDTKTRSVWGSICRKPI